MRKSDATALLGALLGGGTGVRPARRRARAPAGLGGLATGGRSSSSTMLARTAISVLGGIAVEVIRGMNNSAPAAPAPAPAPARRLPDVRGGTPWQAPTSAPVSGKPPPLPQAEPEPESDAESDEALLLVRAMIAAARADGQIDATERRAIAERLDSAGLDAEARDLVLAEFANPIPLEVLVAQVPDPVAAAQVYAASVIAVGEASPAERVYLERLAAALRLTPEAAAAIEARLA
jgi:uncharacterized membrane protein YebE (DUF533 family)